MPDEKPAPSADSAKTDALTQALSNLQASLKDVAAPSGKTGIDGDAPAEGIVLAYEAIDRIAAKIAALTKMALVKSDDPAREYPVETALILNPADMKAFSALRAFTGQALLARDQMKQIAAEAEEALKSAKAAPARDEGATLEKEITLDAYRLTKPFLVHGVAASFAAAALPAALQFATLLRVDTSIKNTKVDPDDRALTVAVMGALKREGMRVYDTATMPLVYDVGARPDGVLAKLAELNGQRAELAGLRERVAETLAEKKEAATKKTALMPLVDALTSVAAGLDNAIATFDAFVASLAKADAASGVTPLSQLLDAEHLLALAGERGVFLWLHSVAVSAKSRTRQWLLWSTIDYSGAAVASYAVYDPSGEVLRAATLKHYVGPVRRLPKAIELPVE